MRPRHLILLLVALAFAINAHATTVDMQLIDVGPGYNDGSYYVYPYNFSINGSGSLISLLCDDFNHDIFFGETWKANVNTFSDILAGGGQMNPSGGLVATGQRVLAYKDAAWLYEQLIDNPTESDAVAINHTVWALFTPTSFNGDSLVASWYAAANQATATLTDADAVALFSDVAFYTPVNGTEVPLSDGLPQEFIGTAQIQTPPKTSDQISVAEPPSFMLLGAGLFGLAAIVRGRARLPLT